MKDTSTTVTIAIVPRDRFSMYPRCLEALYANTDVSFRVIVVVGGCDEATGNYLRKLQAQKHNMTVVIVDHLLTQIEARTLAMQYVSGERYFVVLENDTIVHKNWLAPLLRCMREEGAAAVMPLIFWHRGLHSAGCMFEESEHGDRSILDHRILYTGIFRKRIDYPESHCILLDLDLLTDIQIFDDVEPFDVDLGLTLRRHGLSVLFEPEAVATYSAPPRWELGDIPPFRLRWDPALWKDGNDRFRTKWGLEYASFFRKQASYRRQRLKLSLTRWRPARTIEASNVILGSVHRFASWVTGDHPVLRDSRHSLT
jgi:GT2 family glycosyltransferase